MHVRSLKLAGFKSFADPTILDFDRAISVIVGPNGSGKSNIADALQWVLGSQAPSSLRGASMEDVIFAGSQTRPRLGYSEVEITLDNSDGMLPLDASEVTITRATDRAGASEYKINGAPCRLLDITELLSDTGIGRSIHTIVGQGQLDAVLQARAEDRRSFIEEAAQIGKFRRRKDRALRKIERVEENLTRLGDVVGELRRAIRPLKRQATAAALYSELMAEHRTLKQRLAATEVGRLESEGARIDPEEEARLMQLLSDELAHVRARLDSAAAEKDELFVRADRAQEVAYRIVRGSDRLASSGRLAAERAARIGTRLAVETEETYRERIRLLEQERERWRGETEALRREAQSATAKSEAARADSEAKRGLRRTAEDRLAEARRRETDAAQELVRAEGAEAAGRATLGAIEARVQAALERREIAQNDLEKRRSAMQSTEKEIETLEGELDGAVEKAAAAEARLEEAREKATQLERRLAEIHADRAAATATVEAFEQVGRMFPDLPQVAERLTPLLAEARERFRVAFSDEAEWRSALEAAETDVERLWREVADHDQDLRRLDALQSGAAERLAGTRRKYEAREIELATLDEELASTREALAAAERSAADERAALPARRAALEDAQKARAEAERELTTARAEEDTALAAATAASLMARTGEERALAAQLRLEESEAGIAESERMLAGLEDRRSALQESRERMQQIARIADAGAARARRWAAEAETHAAEARAAASDADRQLGEMRTRERELVGSLEQVSARRNEAEVRRAEIRTRTEAIAERVMEEWALGVDDLKNLDLLEEAEEIEARERAEKLEREMRRLGAVNPNASSEYEELGQREKFLEGQIEDLRASKRDLMKIVRDVDETIVQVFQEAYEAVAHEFETVFQRLFPGGEGRLKLTDPTDLLNTGIEVEARPPGKNVKKLSLLSGGERALVALAFLFAIFRSRPSPFYLLDEVEAALDDINLQRFLGLVAELVQHAQVLIVTHQKRTMEVADVLYGVSMAKDGVSRVVAKRMEEVVL